MFLLTILDIWNEPPGIATVAPQPARQGTVAALISGAVTRKE